MNDRTTVTLSGKGFKQANFCNPKVRLGMFDLVPTVVSDTRATLETVPVRLPGAVVMTMSGNGQ
jgi:hypothetical protein